MSSDSNPAGGGQRPPAEQSPSEQAGTGGLGSEADRQAGRAEPAEGGAPYDLDGDQDRDPKSPSGT